jgi:ribonuclease J
MFRQGARVIYSGISNEFHVSGHAASDDLAMLMHLVNPKKVLPIGGTYKQMIAYKNIAKEQGYNDKDILLTETGQPVIFTKDSVSYGKKVHLKNVFVDAISGEEVETFVLRDRQKLATDGLVIIMVEVNAENGQLFDKPNIIVKGFSLSESQQISTELVKQIKGALALKKRPVSDWVYMRKYVNEVSEKYIFRNLRKRPLILPVVIEV